MSTQVATDEQQQAIARELAAGSAVEIAGFLFDMDGTLVDSVAAVEHAWEILAAEYGVPPLPPGSHGKTVEAVIAEFGIPVPERPAAEARLTAIESREGQILHPMPGVSALIDALPPQRWGIVTSAARPIARARFGASGLPRPSFIVTGDDVVTGKPAPEPFLLGLDHLRPQAGDGPVVVLEDTVAGVTSARAAGCIAIGVLGTMSHSELAAHAHLVISSAEDLSVTADDDRLLLTITPGKDLPS